MAITVKEIASYLNYGRALQLSDGKYEIIATLDVGPRIMHMSLCGKHNVLEDQAPLEEALPDGSIYRILGGHRVWHSPEAYPRSYMRDDKPIARYELFDDGIRLYQETEEWTKIEKSIEARFTPNGIRIINYLTNHGAWEIEMAVWSLSVGSRGGREIIPVVQRNAGLQTNTGYRSWGYSRMDDYRARWGQRYIVVDNNAEDTSAFKFGFLNEIGWMAYFNHGQCFVKQFGFTKGAKYPDQGCNFETYTSSWGVELETLSPFYKVKPGKTIQHEELWNVVEAPVVPERDEDHIAEVMQPIADALGLTLPVADGVAWDPTFEEED